MFIVVFVTASSEQEAVRIGKTLVEEGLVACVNIIPRIRSIYRWKQKICDEAETLLIMKSRDELFERMRDRVRGLHSYEVPEITAVRLEKGDPAYLQWIEDVTKKGD